MENKFMRPSEREYQQMHHHRKAWESGQYYLYVILGAAILYTLGQLGSNLIH